MQNEHEGLERKKLVYQWLILMRMDFYWISKVILSTISRVDNEAVQEMKPQRLLPYFAPSGQPPHSSPQPSH